MHLGGLESREVKVDNVNVAGKVSHHAGVPSLAGKNVLARFRHERKGRVRFFVPVSAHVRVRKVLVPDGLDVLDVDDFAERARVNNILDGAVVWRIAEDFGV